MASTLVIYNPIAGGRRVSALWPRIASALVAAGVDFDAVATCAPGDATGLAQTAATQYSAVVAIGGDGTVSEIVNGLMRASDEKETVPLGIVPLGNGDDFAKLLPPVTAIGGRCYDWRLAVQKIAARQSRLYDVGRFYASQDGASAAKTCRYFVNIVDIGFGAHTVQNFASVPKWLRGNLAYLAAVLKTLIRYPALEITLQLDHGARMEQVTTIAAIGNGRCFGGGFWVCPDAQPDDGWLDVMVSAQITRLTILGLLPKLQRGTHIHHTAVKMSRVRRIVLESKQSFFVEADGEMPIAPTKRLEVDLLPSRLRLIV